MATVFPKRERRTSALVDVTWDMSRAPTATVRAVYDVAPVAIDGHTLTIVAGGIEVPVTLSSDDGFDSSAWVAGDVAAAINATAYGLGLSAIATASGERIILEHPGSIAVTAIDEALFAALGLQMVSVDRSETAAASIIASSAIDGEVPPERVSAGIEVPSWARTVTVYPHISTGLGDVTSGDVIVLGWADEPGGAGVGALTLDAETSVTDGITMTVPTRRLIMSPSAPITIDVPSGALDLHVIVAGEMMGDGGHAKAPPRFSARVAFSD